MSKIFSDAEMCEMMKVWRAEHGTVWGNSKEQWHRVSQAAKQWYYEELTEEQRTRFIEYVKKNADSEPWLQ